MGISGFTKYLEDRSQQYFEKYELHNCSLVIDGHNLCNNLYNWQYEYWNTGFSPYCYGGDYDKYAEIVKQFFQLLHNCNVTPYILFDGCCENDKASLIKQRLNEKVKIYSEIAPALNHVTYAVGAVALRYAFKDVVTKLQLKAYTSISDANTKMACLANILKCPVLSSDSDFFISSTMFIPFSSIDCKMKENENYGYKFIACKMYRIENMINALNKRPDIHYLLPVLLGNYQSDIFNSFFRKFRILGVRQKKIDLIFHWLKKQSTLEAAINEIKVCFANTEQKCSILKVIKHTVMGYAPVSINSLLIHFDIGTKENTEPFLSFEKIEKALGLPIEEEANENIQVSELFEKKFTECQYPAFFLDMLMQNRYYVWPNIEDCSKPDANSVGYIIMSAIHNILVQMEGKRLTVLKRNSNLKLEEFLLPAYKDPLPSIEEIEYLRLEEKEELVFKILEVNRDFAQILKHFPKEWHLFILSLKYASSKSNFTSSFIHSVIFCFLTLNHVDPNLNGFYRSVKDINNIHKVTQNFDKTVEGSKFLTISEEESVVFMQKVVKYFENDPEDNVKTYDRSIMHSIAQFQCAFLHLKYLNALLNYPFNNPFIYKVLDGTFIYNMTKNLGNEASLSNSFLLDCTSIHCVLISVIELLKPHFIPSLL